VPPLQQFSRIGAIALSLTFTIWACTIDPESTDTDGSADDASDPNDPCAPGGLPSLEIGQGGTAYAPLESGGTLELVHGPQGGVHVLVALQAEHIDASEELTAVLRGYVNGEQLGASYPYLDMRCNQAEGGLQSWNLLLIWDAAPEDLHLQTVHIEAEITDASGAVVSACKDAIIHDPQLE
jgi:hypothetical protein